MSASNSLTSIQGQPRIEPLTGKTNFWTWKHAILGVLREAGLRNIVQVNLEKPTESVELTEWLLNDAKAKNIITENCAQSIQHYTQRDTAKEAWLNLWLEFAFEFQKGLPLIGDAAKNYPEAELGIWFENCDCCGNGPYKCTCDLDPAAATKEQAEDLEEEKLIGSRVFRTSS